MIFILGVTAGILFSLIVFSMIKKETVDEFVKTTITPKYKRGDFVLWNFHDEPLGEFHLGYGIIEEITLSKIDSKPVYRMTGSHCYQPVPERFITGKVPLI